MKTREKKILQDEAYALEAREKIIDANLKPLLEEKKRIQARIYEISRKYASLDEKKDES